jgi:hypothetical protein
MRNSWLGFILICTLPILTQNCEGPQPQVSAVSTTPDQTVTKIEMDLSNFGVESTGFPTIKAIIDLKNDTSYCQVTYDDPKFKDRTYRLSEKDMDSVRHLVDRYDFKSLKAKYTVLETDQPTSTNIFYFQDSTIKVEDYGVTEGDFPLKELYHLVYKF